MPYVASRKTPTLLRRGQKWLFWCSLNNIWWSFVIGIRIFCVHWIQFRFSIINYISLLKIFQSLLLIYYKQQSMLTIFNSQLQLNSRNTLIHYVKPTFTYCSSNRSYRYIFFHPPHKTTCSISLATTTRRDGLFWHVAKVVYTSTYNSKAIPHLTHVFSNLNLAFPTANESF